jgi:hypothetical protein
MLDIHSMLLAVGTGAYCIDDQGLTNALLAEAVPYLRMRGRIGEQSEYIEDDEGGGPMLDIQHAWQLALVHIDDQGLTNALLAWLAEAVPRSETTKHKAFHSTG